jgi:hypothetical protein
MELKLNLTNNRSYVKTKHRTVHYKAYRLILDYNFCEIFNENNECIRRCLALCIYVLRLVLKKIHYAFK